MNALPTPSLKAGLRREMLARRDVLREAGRGRRGAALVERLVALPR